MGNFHCISKGCAEVVYRPYESARVRWQYPGEEWQEIEADDYIIKDLPGQCCADYDVTLSYKIANCQGGIDHTNVGTVRIINAIYQGVDYILTTGFTRTQIVVKYFDCVQNKNQEKSVWSSSAKSSFDYPCLANDATYSRAISTWKLVDLLRVDEQPDECKTCKFTIFKNGEIVFDNERPECPEVEQLPCQLSDKTKVIKINKTPYLQRIEVRNQSIQAYGLGGKLIDASLLSKECLNIYKTFVTAPPFPNNFVPTAAILNPYEFVAQICSSPGCPPPEYEVICNCGKECPSGTCPVFCGNHVCCHDPNSGLSVYEIPLSEYSGGN